MSVMGSNVPDDVQTTSTTNTITICDLFDQAPTLLVVIKGVNTCLTNKALPETNPCLNVNRIKLRAVSTMNIINNNPYLADMKLTTS
ncbi:uncharacterized protein PV06_08326 [Exophiala oligosperma]|uniref:Uncharacterized protein n=1 Tax=Exophiala oligosperma TaxID=215243 RepID=A0A0D2BQD1_9EURO|nr:uncharacterized protein PV06_08326 [Exophiala oligosperma]KIW39737.1 hypothetical protein PV06_08326 [Exophiala oligosperma]